MLLSAESPDIHYIIAPLAAALLSMLLNPELAAPLAYIGRTISDIRA